jgi:hypothetical protein
MSGRTLAVEHNGVTYNGAIGVIESTRLGYEDHGILTANVEFKLDGGGVGVGGFVLDKPRDRDAGDYTREGTAYGLDQVIRILETVGVDKWESLRGQKAIVLFTGKPGSPTWGARALGIASLLDSHVLVFQEHADAWAAKNGEVSA